MAVVRSGVDVLDDRVLLVLVVVVREEYGSPDVGLAVPALRAEHCRHGESLLEELADVGLLDVHYL